MKQEIINCSFKDHTKINAIIYCQDCNIYMCNKCEDFHSKLLKNHHTYNLKNNINSIFMGICKEKNHLNSLKYFCQNHNQLCCAACVSIIKDKDNGQHSECDVYPIEEIVKEKKNILKENIQLLQDLSKDIEKKILALKCFFNKIIKNKKKLKFKLKKIFTRIRNEVNKREEKLLLDIDKKFDDNFFKEDFIIESEYFPEQIKENLEKGRFIDKEWNKNTLVELMNDCINFEKNTEKIKEMNSKMEKNYLIEYKLEFTPENNKINEFLEKIRMFGEIYKKELNKFDESVIEILYPKEKIKPIIKEEVEQPLKQENMEDIFEAISDLFSDSEETPMNSINNSSKKL